MFRSAYFSGEYEPKDVTKYSGPQTITTGFSVIIPISASGYTDRLDKCLFSIRNQRYVSPNKLQIVISCIHRGEDITKVKDVADKYKAEVVSGKKDYDHFPLALARNVGAQHSAFNHLVFVDADLVLDRDAIARSEKYKRHIVAIWTSYLKKDFRRKAIFNKNAGPFRKAVRVGEVIPTGYGGFLCTPRGLFFAINGYDEAYDIGWGAEDNDIVDRLVEAGLRKGRKLINLTRLEGILNAHQWHPRVDHTDDEATKKNRERYHNLTSMVRNEEGWGKVELDKVEDEIPPKKDRAVSNEIHALVKQKEITDCLIDTLPVISIIISLSSDKYKTRLRRCLNSIKGQVGVNQYGVEIILSVIQREEEPFKELKNICNEYGAKLIKMSYDSPAFNLALSRNLGAEQARGDVLCFLDSDIIMDPETLSRSVPYVERKRGAVVLTAYSTEDCPDNEYQATSPRSFRNKIKKYEIGKTSYGGCLFIRRSTYLSIRGYDEAYIGWGGEDSDLVKRLGKVGVTFVNVTKREGVAVLHQWHPTIRKEKEAPLIEKNKQRYWDRNLPQRRNVKAMGGVSEGLTTMVLHHPLRPLSCLNRCLRALERSTKDREHVVDVVIQGPGEAPDPERYKKIHINLFQEEQNIGISVPGKRSIESFLERGHRWWAKVDDDILIPRNGLDRLIWVLEYERDLGTIDVGAVQMTTGKGSWVHKPRTFVISRKKHNDGRPIFYTENGYIVERTKNKVTWRIADCTGWGSTVFRRDVFEKGCMPDTRYFVGVIDTDLCYQMYHKGIRIALVNSPACTQLVSECYNKEYKDVRYNQEKIRKSGRRFSDKWGVYYKQLAEYKR